MVVVGGGFIGSAVARGLLDRGDAVTVITRSEPVALRASIMAGSAITIGDASRMEVLAPAISCADRVVYALGSSSPAESELDPAGDISLVLPPLVRLLELLRLRPQIKLTFLSSGGTVYGNAAELPIAETALTRPISSYGILKLACEHYIGMYQDVHGVQASILRVANPYGPGQIWGSTQGIIARLMRPEATTAPIPLYDHGQTVRDYIHIRDLSDAVARAVHAEQLPNVLNIGTGVGHTTREVVDMLAEVTGHAFTTIDFEARDSDVRANVLDISQARHYLGLDPRPLKTGLLETWPTCRES